MTHRAPILWLLLAAMAVSCKAEAPPSASAGRVAAVEAAPPEPEPAPEPVVAADAHGAPAHVEEAPDPVEQVERKAPEPVDPERRLLSAYREVYCLQKKNDQRGVIGVWQQYGYEPATWASDVQAAALRAEEDPKGFGARWAAIADAPCP